MRLTSVLVAAILVAAPTFAAAERCPYSAAAMSCAAGQVYDAEKQACVPVTG